MSDEVLKEEITPVSSESELVPKKAYVEVTNDMFKYKNKLKEAEALLNQMAAEKAAAEIQSLKENEQWKTLYEKNQAQLDSLAAARAQEKDQFVNYHKKAAVVAAIGGFKKDQYADNFINVGAIELDESGNVIQDTLSAEVNRLKQTYPELIKGIQANNLPSDAPKSFENTSVKTYAQMNEREKAAFKMNLIKK